MVSFSDDGGSLTKASLGLVSDIGVFRVVSSLRSPGLSCLSSA